MIHTFVQVAGVAAIVVAVAVLAGWPWALLLGGALAATGSYLVERATPRALPERVTPKVGA